MAKSFAARVMCGGVLVLGVSGAASGQASPNGPPPVSTVLALAETQPLMLLNEAKQALDRVPETTGDPRVLADLRRDFARLRALYLAQNATPTTAAVGASGSTGIAGDAAGGAVGTTGVGGSSPAGISGSLQSRGADDWRMQYAMVSSDIAAVDATTVAGNAVLRSNVPGTPLQEFRSGLERFFMATQGQPVSTSGSTSASPVSQSVTSSPPVETRSNKEALVLLQRMEELLNRTKSDDGRSLKEAGQVKMDRSDIDEIKAEIDQLKAMLQR
jgi:hypothetical protein